MLVLVTYDVCVQTLSGQKRLRRVAKICTNYGIRVQNSVFECVVNQAQFLVLRNKLLKEMDEETDSIRFYHIGNTFEKKVEHYGAKPALQVEEPLIL